MKEKVNKFIRNKYLWLLMPLVILTFLYLFEKGFDKFFGDADGAITAPAFITLKFVIKIGCLLWLVINFVVLNVRHKDLFTGRLKAIFQNKYLRFFLPVILFIILVLVEKMLDTVILDGYGKTFILFVWFIYNILTIPFKMDWKAAVFNIAFMLVILYGFEYFLKKQDAFLKGPFDSNYYASNSIKYENFMEAPDGYSNKNYLTWGKKVVRNEHKFRDTPITAKKPGVFRIMVLGDSFTWGAGLAENEKYSSVLDSMLAAYFKNGNIEVVNCGISGYSTVDERNLLYRLKDTVSPDLIVVGFCMNDPQQKAESYSWEREYFEKRWSGLFTGLQKDLSFFRLNYLGEVLKNALYNTGAKWAKVPGWDESLGRVYDPSSKDWLLFTQALYDIKRVSDSLHCAKPLLGVFNQISTIDFHNGISEAEQQKLEKRLGWLNQVHAAGKKAGFETIDYFPIMDEEVKKKNITIPATMVNPLDAHPSALLNRIYAKELFNRIVPIINSKLSTTLSR